MKYLVINISDIITKLFEFRNDQLILKRFIDDRMVFINNCLKRIKIQFHATCMGRWRMGIHPVKGSQHVGQSRIGIPYPCSLKFLEFKCYSWFNWKYITTKFCSVIEESLYQIFYLPQEIFQLKFFHLHIDISQRRTKDNRNQV